MYCDFYFNSKDAKVRIQICSKILMRIFIFFFWCQPFVEGFEIIIFIFIDFLTLFRPLKWKLHNPIGGRGLLLHSLHLFKLQTEHLQLWKEHVFLFSDVQKGGGKTFDELLKDYSNDKRLVMTQLSVQSTGKLGSA